MPYLAATQAAARRSPTAAEFLQSDALTVSLSLSIYIYIYIYIYILYTHTYIQNTHDGSATFHTFDVCADMYVRCMCGVCAGCMCGMYVRCMCGVCAVMYVRDVCAACT